MADEKLLEFDTKYDNFKKKLVSYFIAKKLTIEMLEKEFNELEPHISQYISLGHFTGLQQIMLDVIGAVIEEISIRGRIPNRAELIKMLEEKEIKNFIKFLCPIYGVKAIRKEIADDFFDKIYRTYIDNIPREPLPNGKYMKIKNM